VNHPFSPSTGNPKLCMRCKREAIDHTDRATCEVCGATGNVEIMQNDIAMCSDCDFKEVRHRTESELNDRALQVQRKFKDIDNQIKIQSDIFNAKTEGIHKMAQAVRDRTDIPEVEKNFIIAKLVDERFQKLGNLIFEKKQEVIEHENEQKAIQIYFNELAKRLKQEERDKLKLKDAQNKPIEAPVKKMPAAPRLKKGPDIVELRRACVTHTIPEFVLSMIYTARNCSSVDQAVAIYMETQAAVAAKKAAQG